MIDHSRISGLVLAFSLLSFSCGRSRPDTSLDPDRFIATAVLDPSLKIELAAREPSIVDPVSISFDAEGRMYAVEMRDYPTAVDESARPIGRIRLLEDTDLDGYYEKSTVFADGLKYPTSVLPWRGGVLVASPPDIIHLRDSNGDGRADQKEVLFSGFPAANTQHNINGFIWGLDNWVYGANGGNDGTAYSTQAPDRKIQLRRSDFRFRPDTGEIEKSYESTGGFEIALDSWGRMFGTHNLNHIQHTPIPTEYLERNPLLAIATTRDPISDHGESAPLYQISEPETRVNHPEQAGRFSGGCGLTYYGGGALSEAFNESFFVTDVVVNVVHQDVLTPEGPSFRARRGRDGVEFLAAKDNWFRPVNLSVGPEGALYVLDMHRAVIEHPEWIPDEVEKRLNLRAGDDKGRIYRITPKNGLKPVRPELSRAAVETLVKALAHSNKWWRDTAQRLLVERQDVAAVPLLVSSARESDSALARLHSLWTLEGLGALKTELVLSALSDEHPGVRENALRMAEPFLERSAEVSAKLLGMTRDPDARVRFQLALTLGRMQGNRTTDALLELLLKDAENQWSRYAVLSSITFNKVEAVRKLLGTSASSPSAGYRDFVRQVSSMIGAGGGPGELNSLLQVCNTSGLHEGWRVSVLDGLADGLARASTIPSHQPGLQSSLDRMITAESAPLVRAALRISARLGLRKTEAQQKALARARDRVLDDALSLEERLEETELLALGGYGEVGKTLHSLMEARRPIEVQTAAARALARIADEDAARAALADWRRYSPQVKGIVLNMLLRRPAFHEILVEAVEKKSLTLGELNLDLEQRRRLLRHSTDDIKKRAGALIGDHEFSNRKEIVDRYISAIAPLRGNAARGEMHHRTLCAKCHVLRGEGVSVGPSLDMAFTKSKEDLLTSILDPNEAIPPEYTNYLVKTTKGDLITGIIRSETPSSLTLVRGDGEIDTILRSQIGEIRTDGQSLMPEGMEKGLRYQDLADLLAFLQQHRH